MLNNGGLSHIPNLNNQYVPTPAISQKIPVYRLHEPYFDRFDVLRQKGEYIKLKSDPHPSMEPMNELAEEKMREYLGKLDEVTEKQAAKDGKPFRSLLDKYEANLEMKKFMDESEDSEEGAISLTGEKVSILGAKKSLNDEELDTDKDEAKKQSNRARMAKARAARTVKISPKNEDLV